jgi:hypothetical protein
MELLNATEMVAGYTMGMRPDGRQLLVVVVKGTFAFPPPGREPKLAEKQMPLLEADVFTGEPGFSATLYESDYAPHKPRCDVLLNGSAYAPRGKAADRVTVSLSVGKLRKSFDVVGKRVWQYGFVAVTETPPEPFTEMPISYDNAFGGMDRSHEDPRRHAAFRPNHAGVGFHVNTAKEAIDGKPLPNTEEHGKPIRQCDGNYRPMAYGAVGRAWLPRASYAGTYDEKWMADVFPFLPADFDERYYQSAPEDQQTDYLQGGEEVELVNLTPDGRRRFHLPQVRVPVEFCRVEGQSETVDAVLDTLLLEPDKKRLLLCWRASIPLKKNMFEVPAGVVGRMPPGWYRARSLGKLYYRNLQELVRSRRSP